jgi:hypothetical protein
MDVPVIPFKKNVPVIYNMVLGSSKIAQFSVISHKTYLMLKLPAPDEL